MDCMQRTVLFSQRIMSSCRGQCCSLKGLCYAEDSVVLSGGCVSLLPLQRIVLFSQMTVLSCRGQLSCQRTHALSCGRQCCSVNGPYYPAEDSVVLSGDCVIIQRTVLLCQRIVL